jgi:hypothetical protein
VGLIDFVEDGLGAKVPLREPTRSLGRERDEKASARFGRDDNLGRAEMSI